MRLGFLGIDGGFGQRPYGRRCDVCAPPSVTTAGPGSFIVSDGGAIPATVLVDGVASTLVTLSFTGRAGDNVEAWGNPAYNGNDGATSANADITLNGVAAGTADTFGIGVPVDGEATPLPVLARFVLPYTGTHILRLNATSVGAGGAIGAVGRLMYLVFRPIP